MSLPACDADRHREIRHQIAALENERDAEVLIENLCYVAGHIAALADAAFDAADGRTKEGLCIMARDLATSLADRLDCLAMASSLAAHAGNLRMQTATTPCNTRTR